MNQSIKSILVALLAIFSIVSCVHDDDYDVPAVVCDEDLTPTTTLSDLKAMYTGSEIEITDDLVIEGYVVSSDEAGNIYKTLYIQDAVTNPTTGLTVSLDVTSTYTKYPIGSKIYIELKGLYLGEYGGVVQLGAMSDGEFGRMSSTEASSRIHRSCDDEKSITPTSVGINDLTDDMVGTLIKIEGVQVTDEFLCEACAYDEYTLNVDIEDCSGNEILLRNSGYAEFADETLPAGKGSITAVLSKYNSDYQLYIRDTNDMDMDDARCDGEVVSCAAPTDNADIADLKALYASGLTQITDDLYVQATVIANDESGNLYKYIYVEDATGGLQVKINKRNLYETLKYQVGQQVVIAAKDLYIDDYHGEFRLGGLYNGNLGNIDEDDVYKHIYHVDGEAVNVTPNIISITDVSDDLVGTLVRFENVQFADSEIGTQYAVSGTTNHTFLDCDGNSLIIRTSSYADFADNDLPTGKGYLTGVLSVYNGTYQVWLRNDNSSEITMEGARCDGTVITLPTQIFSDSFEDLSNWTAVSVTGDEVWEITTYGNPAPSAKISGYSGGNNENEDWLISNAIAVPSDVSTATLSFETVKRYAGDDIVAYYTTNYTGDVSTTTWTQLSATIDSDTGSWSSWTNSGDLDVSSAIGGNLYIAFKYTSTTSAGATFELDNVEVTTTE